MEAGRTTSVHDFPTLVRSVEGSYAAQHSMAILAVRSSLPDRVLPPTDCLLLEVLIFSDELHQGQSSHYESIFSGGLDLISLMWRLTVLVKAASSAKPNSVSRQQCFYLFHDGDHQVNCTKVGKAMAGNELDLY